MNIEIITTIIFILGIMTVILSIVASFKFCGYRRKLQGSSKKLSNAISWQLAGEAIIGLGTLVFACAAHYEVLPSWSIELQSMLRFVMFTATSLTTLHLMIVLIKMERE
jgi:hypothetical protein